MRRRRRRRSGSRDIEYAFACAGSIARIRDGHIASTEEGGRQHIGRDVHFGRIDEPHSAWSEDVSSADAHLCARGEMSALECQLHTLAAGRYPIGDDPWNNGEWRGCSRITAFGCDPELPRSGNSNFINRDLSLQLIRRWYGAAGHMNAAGRRKLQYGI